MVISETLLWENYNNKHLSVDVDHSLLAINIDKRPQKFARKVKSSLTSTNWFFTFNPIFYSSKKHIKYKLYQKINWTSKPLQTRALASKVWNNMNNQLSLLVSNYMHILLIIHEWIKKNRKYINKICWIQNLIFYFVSCLHLI